MLNNLSAPLNCMQVYYRNSHGNQTYPYCPGSVCWNSSSLVGSSSDLENVLGVAAHIDAAEHGGTGDVRIRYRYQNNTLYGFAYRCKEPEPAGCEQMWRGEWKFPVDCVLESIGCPGAIHITDVGQIDDFSGACAMNNYTCE